MTTRATTTRETITKGQIRQLMVEAHAARDWSMVATCDRALEGVEAEVVACVDAIRDAEEASRG